jgi:hypothetical protein
MAEARTDRNRLCSLFLLDLRASRLAVTIWALLSVGCASQDRGVSVASVETLSNAGAIDCVVPGQIRQLGRELTYLSRSRVIRTSISDCAIRGGSPRSSSAESASAD